jgi:hypothetical protein
MQLAAMSPSQYFVGIFGALVGVQNTLLLFKFSVFVDYLIFAYGVYLFSREAYRSRVARWLVTIGALCSISWLVQICFNFHNYYLFPFSLWALLKYKKTGLINYVGTIIIVEVISVLGNAPYFPQFHFLVLCSIFIVFFSLSGATPLAKTNRKTPIMFAVTVAVCALLITFTLAHFSTHGATSLAGGRDHGNFKVSLETFLNYGRLTPMTTIVGWVSGAVFNVDNTYYVGLLPLFLVFYGIIKVRHPLFIALFTAFIVLFWLSIGGIAARIIYFSPGMSIIRHIGLTFALADFLMLLASGFVLDQLVNHTGQSENKGNGGLLLINGLILGLLLDCLFSWRAGDFNLAAPVQVALLPLIAIRLILYWFWLVVKNWFAPATVNVRPYKLLLFIFVIDIGTYYATVIYNSPSVKETYEDAFLVQDYKYNPSRKLAVNLISNESSNPKVRFLEEIRSKYQHNALYALSYSWINFDPCYPVLRNDLWHPLVLRAISSRGGIPRLVSSADFFLSGDRNFAESLGCESSKIRLVRKYVVATGAEDIQILKNLDNPRDRLVLSDARPSYDSSESEPPAGTVEVVHYSANRVQIHVNLTDGKPALLFYADAWDSGWSAKIDGLARDIIKANVGFKAIEVMPGNHIVEFNYGKWSTVTLSNLVALLGILAVITLFVALVNTIRYEWRTVPQINMTDQVSFKSIFINAKMFDAGFKIWLVFSLGLLTTVIYLIFSNVQPSLLVEGHRGFNIIGYQNRIYAILQSDGAFSIDRINNNSYSRSVIGSSVAEVKQAIDRYEGNSYYPQPVILVENYRGLKIIGAQNRVYAVPPGEGTVNILFTGTSLKEVMQQIDNASVKK